MPFPLVQHGHVIRAVRSVCEATAPRTYLGDIRARARSLGLSEAVRQHKTPVLFDWLIDAFSYQGISDNIAWQFMNEHGRVTWADLDRNMAASPSCPRLLSYWHFRDCRYGKLAQACSEPGYFGPCPVPTHDLRNGRLNQTAYALFLFLRDVCDGDLVGWIDDRLAGADHRSEADRTASMREALLGPLGRIHGISWKVLSMALAELLLGADPDRERWVATGARMVAVDTLVHNWLHRTGILRRLGAQHAYGPGCYAPGGCADILDAVAQLVDARDYCAEGAGLLPSPDPIRHLAVLCRSWAEHLQRKPDR